MEGTGTVYEYRYTKMAEAEAEQLEKDVKNKVLAVLLPLLTDSETESTEVDDDSSKGEQDEYRKEESEDPMEEDERNVDLKFHLTPEDSFFRYRKVPMSIFKTGSSNVNYNDLSDLINVCTQQVTTLNAWVQKRRRHVFGLLSNILLMEDEKNVAACLNAVKKNHALKEKFINTFLNRFLSICINSAYPVLALMRNESTDLYEFHRENKEMWDIIKDVLGFSHKFVRRDDEFEEDIHLSMIEEIRTYCGSGQTMYYVQSIGYDNQFKIPEGGDEKADTEFNHTIATVLDMMRVYNPSNKYRLSESTVGDGTILNVDKNNNDLINKQRNMLYNALQLTGTIANGVLHKHLKHISEHELKGRRSLMEYTNTVARVGEKRTLGSMEVYLALYDMKIDAINEIVHTCVNERSLAYSMLAHVLKDLDKTIGQLGGTHQEHAP